MQQSPKILISGGGTGGHIFPAIAIANAIKAMQPNADILFVGAKDKMEMQKVPEAGYPIEGLWISGIQRSLTLKNLAFPFKLLSSLIKSYRIFNKFKPNVAIGVGGFASGPMLWVAAQKGIPTVIQEQNSYPGITNKLLANKASLICVAYNGLERFFPKSKIKLTGNPVRKQMVTIENKSLKAFKHFNLNPDKPTVLIMGGSLGARSINQGILNGLQQFIDAGIQLIWQTGKVSFESITNQTQNFNLSAIRIVEFIKEMDLAYAAAHVIVSRAGAMAVSELCLVQKPCILVPLPTAAEDHQTKNAQALVNYNAAILVKDSDAYTSLATQTIELVNNKAMRDKLSENIAGLGTENAAENIAGQILALIPQNKA